MLIWSISYPVCLPSRWKWEEINIGLSHHLLVHHSKVQHPAEDFDYFPLLWQTRSSLRSLSLFSFFLSHFSLLFLSSFPCCLGCSSLIWRFSTHQVWPIVISSLLTSILPPHPHPHPLIETHVDHLPFTVQVRGHRELVLLTSVWVCVSGDKCGDGLTHKQTYMHDFINHPIKCCWHNFFLILK